MKRVDDGLKIYYIGWIEENWPNFLPNSWIGIDKNIPTDDFRNAYLILNDKMPNHTIKLIDGPPENDNDVICKMSWTETDVTIDVTFLMTRIDYSGRGIGYFLSVGLKSWLQYKYNKIFRPPPPEARSPEVERIIKRCAIEHEDDFAEFLADDGKYYLYSEWIKTQS